MLWLLNLHQFLPLDLYKGRWPSGTGREMEQGISIDPGGQKWPLGDSERPHRNGSRSFGQHWDGRKTYGKECQV